MGLLFFGVGFAAQTTQVVVFRESFLNLNGSELSFGFVLAIWLMWGALGSLLGSLVRDGRVALPLGALLLVASLPVTIHIMRISRAILNLPAGRLPPLWGTLLVCGAGSAPSVFLCGFLFATSLAVNANGPNIPPTRCYGVDALGDVVAGSVSAALLALGFNHITLTAFGCSILSLALFFLVRRSALHAMPLIASIILILASPYLERSSQNRRWRSFNPKFQLMLIKNSPYGETSVVTMGSRQSDIFYNGSYIFSVTPEGESYEAAKEAHPLLCVHPSPHSVLILGGAPEMAPELLRHPLKRLDCVFLDPVFAQVLSELRSPPFITALKDNRLKVHIQDPRRFLTHSEKGVWDIIAVTGGLPSTLAANRLFTQQFLRIAKERLAPGGILAFAVHSAPSMQETQLRRLAVLAKTLRTAFKHIKPTTAGWLFASDSEIEVNPAILEARYKKRSVSSPFFVPEYFATLLYERDQKRLEEYTAYFMKSASINSDTDPALVRDELLFLGQLSSEFDELLVEASQFFRVWHLLVAAAVISLLLFLPRGRIFGGVGSAGFAGLAAGLIVLHLFQTTTGATYLLLGVLTALFMLGLWCGSRVVGMGKVWRFSGGGLGVVALVAFLVGSSSGLLMFLLNFVSGFCVGAVYGRATAVLKGWRWAGWLFAADLAGGTAAALLVGCSLLLTSGIPAVVAVTATFAAVSSLLLK